jgi:hypothetical protein
MLKLFRALRAIDDVVMPGMSPAVVRLSGEERERLETLIRKGKSPARRVLKARPIAAQRAGILLYRNLLRSHDCLPRQSLATKANH